MDARFDPELVAHVAPLEPPAPPPEPAEAEARVEAPEVAGPTGAGAPAWSPAGPAGTLWDDAGLEAEPAAAATEDAGRVPEHDEIAQLLTPFFHKGYVARREARGLMDPGKRAEAERRLNAVGLTLAWSPYSRYYGLALADGPGHRVERITNMQELDRNALALLVVLWARLVLPQRLAEEGREGGVAEPVVSFEALNAEFGKKLGGRRFEMYVSQLKRLGFLEYNRKDEIKAGPFLDLLGDSQKLSAYLRQSTLARVLAEQPVADEPDEGGTEIGWHAAAALAEAAAGPIVWAPAADEAAPDAPAQDGEAPDA
ncbi:MAG: hypothetical protein VKQ33_01130 [Candidatus Sericytochromatia bacterium]|nr:hypothetical protein [Candidatus Sericytochromatia bacterium]